jgi:hypothetical protein
MRLLADAGPEEMILGRMPIKEHGAQVDHGSFMFLFQGGISLTLLRNPAV